MKTFLNLRKKWVLALVAAAVVGSGAYAFAATLTVSSASLGAGNATVASCVTSTRATYTTEFDPAVTGKYRVASVTLTIPVGSTCAANDKLSVSLEGTSGLLGSTVNYTLQTGDLPVAVPPTAGSAVVTIPSSNSIAANEVTGVAVSAAGV
jgi:hypothetical protein